tara:strand:+ start:8861 stop:10636 length:1776 start_codon:yes stop_codon:yes gene_type:complete
VSLYVEIAQESPRNRGLLVLKSELPRYINEDVPLYRSFYLYDETALDIANSENSIKNYSGPRYLDYVLIDIDKQDNSHELTLNTMKSVLFALTEGGLDDDNMQPYFSGTGYHLAIHADVFNFEATNELPLIVKATLQNLIPEADSAIFSRTGIYRVAHTKNQKSGLYKIPLTVDETMNLNHEKIFEMAKEQRLEFPYKVLCGEGEFESKIEDKPELQSISFRKVTEPSKITPCIQTMFRQGPVQGRRHKTILRLASHFRRHGFPSDVAKAAILNWNNNNLDNESVITKVDSAYNGGYRYGCQDELLAQNCQTKCIYFKNKDYMIEVKNSKDMQEEFEERMNTDFSGKVINLSKMLGLGAQIDSTIYPGELVTVFGPTGSSKTTFVQNLALGVDFLNNQVVPEWQIPTLFLSLELSSWYMHRRHMQIVSGMSKDDVNADYKNVYMQNKDLLKHLVVQTVSPTIENIQQKIRELQPALVIVDYIDLVETPRNVNGEYAQIKYVSHNLSNMAVNNDCIIIQVSQVSREYSRNEVLDLYAGKGSGAIENASRKVIGLNGQANSSEKSVQLFKNTDGELFQVDVEWQPSFRLRRKV